MVEALEGSYAGLRQNNTSLWTSVKNQNETNHEAKSAITRNRNSVQNLSRHVVEASRFSKKRRESRRRRIGKKSGKAGRLALAIYPHLSPPPSFHFGSRRDNRATVARRDSGGLILDRFRSYSIRAPYCPQSTLRVVSFT